MLVATPAAIQYWELGTSSFRLENHSSVKVNCLRIIRLRNLWKRGQQHKTLLTTVKCLHVDRNHTIYTVFLRLKGPYSKAM